MNKDTIAIITEVQKYANEIAGKKVPRQLVENGIFFTMSSISGMNRLRFIGMNGKEQYANFFGVSIADSGVGKDTALKAAYGMFEKQLSRYPEIVKNNFESLNQVLPTGEKLNALTDFIVPTSYSFPLRGSVEGMMRAGNFYNRTSIGSLNVISTEFGSEYNPEVLPILTTLWQDAKADGSTNVNEKYPPINDVPTNTLLFGAASAFHKNDKKHAYLSEAIESGFARRCNFVWVEAGQIETYTYEKSIIDSLQDYASQVIHNMQEIEIVKMENDAKEEIKAYLNELIAENNKGPSNWTGIKVSSVDKVQRLSALIAILDVSKTISASHMRYAIQLNEESFEAMRFILSPHSQYKIMYNILSTEEELSQTEFIDYGVKIKTKADWEYQLELLEDLAYRKNMVIKKRGKKVMLRKLPSNNLKQMIVSTSVNNPVDQRRPRLGDHHEWRKYIIKLY